MTLVLSLKTKIITPRVEETRAWYVDLFGMTVVEQWDEPGDKGCILALRSDAGQALLEIYHEERAFDFSGLSLQFRVDDVQQFADRHRTCFAFEGPYDRPWGSRYLFFTDPNGISVVVFSGSSL